MLLSIAIHLVLNSCFHLLLSNCASDNGIVSLVLNDLFDDIVFIDVTATDDGTLVFRLPREDNFIWNGLDSPMVGAVQLQGDFLEKEKVNIEHSPRIMKSLS